MGDVLAGAAGAQRGFILEVGGEGKDAILMAGVPREAEDSPAARDEMTGEIAAGDPGRACNEGGIDGIDWGERD